MLWHDRAGQFSTLKAIALLSVTSPAVVMAYRYLSGVLGARPITELIHDTGLWAIRLLFISLAITPARQILQLPRLIILRRMLGVGTFCYAATHLAMDAADKMFDLALEIDEIARRFYLAIGAAALILLLALAATSTDAMVRRLGGSRWQALQRFVYVIAGLAALHFFLQSKIDATEPTIMFGLLIWLLAYRVLCWYGGTSLATAPWSLLLLGLGSALATALGEVAYFGAFTGIDPALVLGADLSFAAGPRPTWIVLIAGTLAASAAATRRQLRS
jgi:sulfoxide reductase heme-binding subunit YedZ